MIRSRTRRDPLGTLPLFAPASDAMVARAASLLTGVTVPAGTVLLREGHPGRQFVLVQEGMVRVTRGTGPETEELAVLGAGQYVGEMSLLEGGLAAATVTTLTEVTAYVASAQEFATLLADLPELRDGVTRTAAQRRTLNTAG